MNRPAKPAYGKCPQGPAKEKCNLVCKYNYFAADDLKIDSWELKCLDCGLRQTIAYRSDDEPEDIPDNPKECPFCHLCDLAAGKNPCQT